MEETTHIEGCVFCNIAKGEVQTNFILNEEDIMAFDDINPKAPVHILIVPKKHIESVKDLEKVDEKLVGRMVLKAKEIARERSLDGYKLIWNVGKGGGQIINHLHLHLLGGEGIKMP